MHGFIYSAVSMLYINSVLTNICYEKLVWKQRLEVYLFGTMVTFLMHRTYSAWINVIIIPVTYLLIIWRQKHVIINAVGMMLNYIIGVCINYIALAVIYGWGLSIEYLSANMLYYLIYCLCLTAVLEVITGWLGKYMRRAVWRKDARFEKDKKQKRIVYLIFIEISSCGMVYVFNVIYGNYVGYSVPVLLFNGVTFLILFVATGIILYRVYVILKEDYELRLQIAEAEVMAEYTKGLESLYQEVRSFKHDYMNILSSMYAYLEEQRYGELKQYFEQNILPDGKRLASGDGAIGRLGNLKIMEIKGILYAKVLRASREQLEVTVDIPEEITDLNVSVTILVRILGILLDNAIDAAAKTEEKRIDIGILAEKEWNYIRISNSSNPIKNILRLFEQGYSEKEGHMGIGLYEVDKLLARQERIFLNVSYEEKEFIQLLQIKNKQEKADASNYYM